MTVNSRDGQNSVDAKLMKETEKSGIIITSTSSTCKWTLELPGSPWSLSGDGDVGLPDPGLETSGKLGMEPDEKRDVVRYNTIKSTLQRNLFLQGN